MAFNDAWRGVSRQEIAWSLAIGITFMVAHAYSLAPAQGRGWPFPIRVYEWFYVPACLTFLVAFRFAEHSRMAPMPGWQRYAIAIPLAALLFDLATIPITVSATSEKHAISGASAYIWSAIQALLMSVIVAIVYSSVMRSRRAQAAFDAAALQRAATARRVTEARLSALQAHVDPAFLFSTLELVETLYERDPDAAERALSELIDFLRTALPRIGEEGATLGRELHLARAYLAIMRARMGSRLEIRTEIPREIEAASFPAMLLVPLVERAVNHGLEPLPHGGRLEINAAQKADRLEVTVLQTGARDDSDEAWLDALRDRLASVYGDGAHLTVAAGAQGTAATLDVPYETAPAELPSVSATSSIRSLQ